MKRNAGDRAGNSSVVEGWPTMQKALVITSKGKVGLRGNQVNHQPLTTKDQPPMGSKTEKSTQCSTGQIIHFIQNDKNIKIEGESLDPY